MYNYTLSDLQAMCLTPPEPLPYKDGHVRIYVRTYVNEKNEERRAAVALISAANRRYNRIFWVRRLRKLGVNTHSEEPTVKFYVPKAPRWLTQVWLEMEVHGGQVKQSS